MIQSLDTYDEPDRYLLTNGHADADKEELRELIHTHAVLQAKLVVLIEQLEHEVNDR
jgi:hypothetical protein